MRKRYQRITEASSPVGIQSRMECGVSGSTEK